MFNLLIVPEKLQPEALLPALAFRPGIRQKSLRRAEGESLPGVIEFKGAEVGNMQFALSGSLLYGVQHRLDCGGGGAACCARAHIALNPGYELFFIHRAG